ncbi:acetyl-CoA carboxylase, biotin carboxyl carrier protein [Hydrococcus rivularis NIES-593]|uniref:Biotin carboxyl carrier protein of acetyl-CoA carboxylase n=1 Tax=Hydrococcus rivularis NIES-593 TaxID=1921803 RepID=A0A1U7HG89_9CYAN|nr:acetyl-CoA carboxylase biotin carboxyl carrier protein [Hydrococcus rivularis]OKH22603.1 acetyl-CoA carboxylase, biotin carboxyl carrier protein [Hydrococcus rivularis NIES-593]
MSINFNELRELLRAIAQTDITELTLKSEDFELTVRKSAPVIPTQTVAATVEAAPPSGVSPVSQPSAVPVAPVSEPQEVSAPSPADAKWVAITSPMVGTFYRAPAPDEPPFVEVGDRIRQGQTVCIIEAMKLMNEIEAEVSGQIMEIVVANGEPVEYGQTLMWLNPD